MTEYVNEILAMGWYGYVLLALPVVLLLTLCKRWVLLVLLIAFSPLLILVGFIADLVRKVKKNGRK